MWHVHQYISTNRSSFSVICSWCLNDAFLNVRIFGPSQGGEVGDLTKNISQVMWGREQLTNSWNLQHTIDGFWGRSSSSAWPPDLLLQFLDINGAICWLGITVSPLTARPRRVFGGASLHGRRTLRPTHWSHHPPIPRIHGTKCVYIYILNIYYMYHFVDTIKINDSSRQIKKVYLGKMHVGKYTSPTDRIGIRRYWPILLRLWS